MIIIIPAKKLRAALRIDSFTRRERLLVCVSGEQGSTVIMGLKQYLQARDRASREEQQREVSAKK